MPDAFDGFQPTPTSSPDHAFAIAPHASNPLPWVTRAIWVGGAGDLVVRLAGDSADVTLSAVPAGSLLPMRAAYVRATSSASLLVGLY